MIVKIQRSQPPSAPGQVLIYSRSGYWWQGNPDPQIEEWLGGRQKVYAHAHVDDGYIVIERTAKWQSW